MSDWKKDFPSYDFEERDIVVAEYESGVRTIDSEEKLFTNATNITAAVSAAIGSIAIGSSAQSLGNAFPFRHGDVAALGALAAVVIAYSLVTLVYFADRRKSITYAKRKIIVLRRMLGLEFGSQQLALPAHRIEAADYPYRIRLFPGWLTYVAYPFWIIAVFSAVVLWFLGGQFLSALPNSVGFSSSLWVLLAVVGAWFLIVAFLYRGLLYDEYENFCLSSAQCVAGILRLDLIGNVGHAMYEARRAVQEHRRKGIDLDAFHDILIFIEDRQFSEHSGLSLRGYGRAITSFLGYRRRSGGSTITQQLARTLLIMEFSKTVRRKILEIPLAWWLEKTLSKGEILNLHLVSVRFAYGRNGVLDALNHFFGSTDKRVEDIQLSEARRFFLIERISNVRNDVLAAKIDDTLRQARSHGVIADSTPSEVVRVYKEMIDHDILNPQDSEAVERLFQKWRRPQ